VFTGTGLRFPTTYCPETLLEGITNITAWLMTCSRYTSLQALLHPVVTSLLYNHETADSMKYYTFKVEIGNKDQVLIRCCWRKFVWSWAIRLLLDLPRL